MNPEFRFFRVRGICVLSIPLGRCGGSRAWPEQLQQWPGTVQGVMGGVVKACVAKISWRWQ